MACEEQKLKSALEEATFWKKKAEEYKNLLSEREAELDAICSLSSNLRRQVEQLDAMCSLSSDLRGQVNRLAIDNQSIKSPSALEDLLPEPAEDVAPEPAEDVAPEPAEDVAPEPAEDLAPEDSSTRNVSNKKICLRNIRWTFKNLRTLIGTDLPLFGGRKHRCVSLGHSDLSKPINILTSVDSWLDNLVQHTVPDVIMCYHVRDFDHEYQMVETEELPQIIDSEVPPHLIKDIAHNILSFMKTEDPKEGHTYWLLKGKDCESLKLYDITSLGKEKSQEPTMEEAVNDPHDNPFRVPVAMLYYAIANYLQHSEDFPNNELVIKDNEEVMRDNEADIRATLLNTISLLHQRKYPEIYSSSQYMLSDLYIPRYINAECDVSAGLKKSGWDFEDNKMDINQTIRKKCVPLKKGSESRTCEPPLITKNVFERCEQALSHVLAALHCLRKNMPEETEEESSWRYQLLMLCLRKSALIYLVLARMHFNNKRYDLTIEHIKTSLLSWNVMMYYKIKDGQIFFSCEAYILACETYYHMSEDLNYVKKLDNMHQLHLNMVAILDEIMDSREFSNDDRMPACFSGDLGLPSNKRAAITYSVTMFKSASVAIEHSDDILVPSMKRLMICIGDKLGVLCMNEAKICYETGVGNAGEESSSYYWSTSRQVLVGSLKLCHEGKDTCNMAVMHNRIASLYCMKASYVSGRNNASSMHPMHTTTEEMNWFKMAIGKYEDALKLLRSPTTEKQKEIVELINWEFRATLYTVGAQLHENPIEPLSEGVDKVAVGYLERALTLCISNPEEAKLPLHQKKVAEINHKLAGLYHKASYRDVGRNRNRMRRLAEPFYTRACVLFVDLEDPFDTLKVHLDHAGLLEDDMEGCNNHSRLNYSYSVLELLLSCRSVLYKVSPRVQSPDTYNRNNSGKKMRNKNGKKLPNAEKEEMTEEEKIKLNNLLEIFEKKLQTTLLSMMNIVEAVAERKENWSCVLLKSLYSKSLNLQRQMNLASHLVESLTKVHCHWKELKELNEIFLRF